MHRLNEIIPSLTVFPQTYSVLLSEFLLLFLLKISKQPYQRLSFSEDS